MKLSDEFIKICRKHYSKFNECECPIKDICYEYRQNNIKRDYEEFKNVFHKMEKLINEVKNK